MEKKKSLKWLIADLICMYIITGLGLVLLAVLLEKMQQGETFVKVGIVIVYILSGGKQIQDSDVIKVRRDYGRL